MGATPVQFLTRHRSLGNQSEGKNEPDFAAVSLFRRTDGRTTKWRECGEGEGRDVQTRANSEVRPTDSFPPTPKWPQSLEDLVTALVNVFELIALLDH